MSQQDAPTSLEEAMVYIGERYTFTPNHYPLLRQRTTFAERRAFVVSHSTYHISKSLGRMSAECEMFDHGFYQMKEEVLKEAIVKMLINILKLAEELDMTAEDLLKAIPQYMISK